MSASEKDKEEIRIVLNLADGESFVMPKDTTKIYRLEDAFVNDPFTAILDAGKKEGGSNYAIYADYEQSLEYLRAIWKRLQTEYWNLYLTGSKITFEMEFDPNNEYLKERIRMIQLIELDSESFIIFANRFMDKVGKVIERKIKPNDKRQVGASFKEHVAFFTDPENQHYNLNYSKYLKINTSWYNLLSVMRDKLIEHGKSFTTSLYISQNHGIMYLKIDNGIDRPLSISTNDAETLDQIWQKYPQVQNVISGQSWRIIRHIMKNNIELSDEDFKKFTMICTRMGGFIDGVGMARHVERFLTESSKAIVS
jgi:hypothetical protein